MLQPENEEIWPDRLVGWDPDSGSSYSGQYPASRTSRNNARQAGKAGLPATPTTPGEPAPLAGSLLAMPALDLGRVLRPLTQDDDILAEMLEGYFI